MKGLIFLFSLVLILFSCSEDSTIEDQMYEEVKAELKKDGIDLEQLLDDIEEEYISQGVLSGKGGLAKVKFYENIVASGQLPSIKNLDKVIELEKLKFSYQVLEDVLYKVEKKDSVAFAKSSFQKITQSIKENVVKQGSMSPVTVAKAILSELDAEDLEHPFYRMFMLLPAAMTMDKDTACTREIPKHLETPEVEEKNKIVIRLNAINEITIDGKKYSLDKLDMAYSWAHDKIGPDAVVYMHVHKMSSYGSFSAIHSAIEKYSTNARNAEAQRSFHMNYNELNQLQKNQVNEAHPINVIEAKFE